MNGWANGKAKHKDGYHVRKYKRCGEYVQQVLYVSNAIPLGERGKKKKTDEGRTKIK